MSGFSGHTIKSLDSLTTYLFFMALFNSQRKKLRMKNVRYRCNFPTSVRYRCNWGNKMKYGRIFDEDEHFFVQFWKLHISECGFGFNSEFSLKGFKTIHRNVRCFENMKQKLRVNYYLLCDINRTFSNSTLLWYIHIHKIKNQWFIYAQFMCFFHFFPFHIQWNCSFLIQ